MAEEKQRVAPCSYVLYYIVLFFAYWFGSNRFDVDGDGDFDPEDVQAYLADKGFVKKNFKQSRTGRAKAKKAKAKSKAAVKDVTAGSSPQGQSKPKSTDSGGDGEVGIEDFIASKVDGEAAEMEMMENLIEKQQVPWFMTFECMAVFFLWFVFAIKDGLTSEGDPLQAKAGLDSIAPGMTVLQWAGANCEDYSKQVWRWVTYQFTHVGAMHALMNVFLCVMLGIPLEGLHGHWRTAVMFNVGVLGGALCYMLTDAHTAVVGCSGGCYALIGIHFADLIMNWRQKKFRIPTIIFLVLLVSVDVFSYVMSLSEENSSHAAHIGGAVSGLIIGVLVCRNLKMYWHEKVLMAMLFVLGLGLVGFSFFWIFSAQGGPINIFEMAGGENGYCWVRQVYLPSVDESQWLCVRCGTQSCIDLWEQQKYLETVSMVVCQEKTWYYDGR
mmetsp:Transcript_56560/g.143090  ORF Transcript_56560/g.143090 Transcript_56560/m.143090 type:complete len:439 (+) Transcript_56560:160-1476(+)